MGLHPVIDMATWAFRKLDMVRRASKIAFIRIIKGPICMYQRVIDGYNYPIIMLCDLASHCRLAS